MYKKQTNGSTIDIDVRRPYEHSEKKKAHNNHRACHSASRDIIDIRGEHPVSAPSFYAKINLISVMEG